MESRYLGPHVDHAPCRCFFLRRLSPQFVTDTDTRVLSYRTAYILGKIAAKEGQWQQAADYLQRAYDLQYPGKPTHQSVASARYHQALVCLQKPGAESGSDEQALRYLRQALEITQFNEARRGDQGESARVKWLISKIWERQGRAEDAEIYRTEALKTKKELERTGRHPKSPDAEQEWDCFSDLVDR